MSKQLVKCLYCGQEMNRDLFNVISVGKRYAHDYCYQKNKDKELVEQKIHFKMKNILGDKYTKTKIDRQIKSLVQSGRTVEGILQTLDYWFDVKEGDPEASNGGIGIVDFVYNEAMEYYERQEEIKHRYEGIDANDYMPKSDFNYQQHSTPFKKPKRVKLFTLN